MNLFKQAMYSKKIRSKEDAPKNTNNRDIMCSQGITGVKAGSLSHGQKWRQHKYLYKEGDRYIYPEDVQKKKSSNDTLKKVGEAVLSTNKLTKYPYLAYKAGQKIKPQTANAAEPEEKRTGIIHEKRQKAKEEEKRRIERNREVAAWDAQEERKERTGPVDAGGYSRSNRPEDLKTGWYKREDDKAWDEHERNLKRIKLKTKQKKNAEKYKSDEMFKVGAQAKLKKGVDNMRRNAAINEGLAAARKELEDRNRKRRDQQHSAHQNAYYYDPPSTEELERQKAKAYARKRLKNDDVNRFGKDPAIDNDPEVRAARKKWLGNEENDGKIQSNSAAGKSINKRKLLDSVNSTPHEGSKRKARMERNIAQGRAANARNEYLEARQRAAEREYLNRTRKAGETIARTDDTVERMRRKKKKRTQQ